MFSNSIMFPNTHLFPRTPAFNPAIVPLIARQATAPQDGTLSRQELRRLVADMVD